MVDINNQELQVGDKIIYTSGQYLGLRKATIKKVTDRTVTVDNGNNYKWSPNEDKILDPSRQVMKL